MYRKPRLKRGLLLKEYVLFRLKVAPMRIEK